MTIWNSERRLGRHCAIYGAKIDLAGLLCGVLLGMYERRRRRDGNAFRRFIPYAVQKWSRGFTEHLLWCLNSLSNDDFDK